MLPAAAIAAVIGDLQAPYGAALGSVTLLLRSSTGRVPRGQFLPEPGGAADAGVEVAQVEPLVRRVGVLVGQADAEEDRLQPEDLLERGHDRYAAALAGQDRPPTEAVLDRPRRRLHRRVIDREQG